MGLLWKTETTETTHCLRFNFLPIISIEATPTGVGKSSLFQMGDDG